MVGVEARVFDDPDVLLRVTKVEAVVAATEIASVVAVIVLTLCV
jgi:hypothetical protein